jgi:hypothetical protein
MICVVLLLHHLLAVATAERPQAACSSYAYANMQLGVSPESLQVDIAAQDAHSKS